MESVEVSEFKNFQTDYRILDELVRLLEMRLLILEERVSRLETLRRSR
jgi:hypothetical protein